MCKILERPKTLFYGLKDVFYYSSPRPRYIQIFFGSRPDMSSKSLLQDFSRKVTDPAAKAGAAEVTAQSILAAERVKALHQGSGGQANE